MVESAKEMPVRRDSKYPWEEWERRTLEGEVLIAKQGVDFDISATNFQVVLHTHASDVGLKVRTRTTEDGRIAFQFFHLAPKKA